MICQQSKKLEHNLLIRGQEIEHGDGICQGTETGQARCDNRAHPAGNADLVVGHLYRLPWWLRPDAQLADLAQLDTQALQAVDHADQSGLVGQ